MDELERSGEKQPKRSGREESRLAAAVVLAGLGTAFGLLNLGHAKINYVFGTGHPRIIFVIVACLLLGAAIGWLAARRRLSRKD
jgi:Flp pilus assembly protein TadB